MDLLANETLQSERENGEKSHIYAWYTLYDFWAVPSEKLLIVAISVVMAPKWWSDVIQ